MLNTVNVIKDCRTFILQAKALPLYYLINRVRVFNTRDVDHCADCRHHNCLHTCCDYNCLSSEYIHALFPTPKAMRSGTREGLRIRLTGGGGGGGRGVEVRGVDI